MPRPRTPTTSAPRTTCSATSTARGWRRRRSPRTSPGSAGSDLLLESEADVGDILREASEASAAGMAPHGSDRQKIGDLFASFMDEDAIDALGAAPLADD